jgi:hypothetical protein
MLPPLSWGILFTEALIIAAVSLFIGYMIFDRDELNTIIHKIRGRS